MHLHTTIGLEVARRARSRLVLLLLVILVSAGIVASSATSSPPDLTNARQLVKQASKRQTTWLGPKTAPKPKSGLSIGVLTCPLSLAGCASETQGVREAGKALGWKVRVVDGRGDAAVGQAAIESFIIAKVDGIVLVSTPAQSVSEPLSRATKAGIPFVSSFSPDPRPYGGLINIGIVDRKAGEVMAAYVLTHGGGNIIDFTSKENSQIYARSQGFAAYIAKYGGSTAKVVLSQSIPLAQVGPPVTEQMSALLQRYPKGKIKWIHTGFDALLRFALDAARTQGRTELLGASYDGDLASLDLIRKGNLQVVTMGYPLVWAGWATLDEINRAVNGQPVAPDEGVRFKLLDKSNLPASGQAFQGDLDFRAQYKKLWGK